MHLSDKVQQVGEVGPLGQPVTNVSVLAILADFLVRDAVHHDDLGCHLGELVWNEDSDVERLCSPREHQRDPELFTHLVAPDEHHILEELTELTQLRLAHVLHGHHLSRYP